MPVYNYAPPRCPVYKKPSKLADCLPQARKLVKKEQGRAALGPVKKGGAVLIVTLPDQDEFVQEAIIQALREEGAEKVDFIFEHTFSELGERVFSVEDGWREAGTMESEPWDMSGSQFYSDIAAGLRDYLTQHPEYATVYFGLGGRNHLMYQLKEYFVKYKECWLFNNWEEFLSKAWTYPDELLIEIERRIIAVLGQASMVRITDPEGTHLEYPLTAEEARRWQRNAWWAGHLNLDLLMATTEESAKLPVSPAVPPVFRDVNGVLAGTSNHMGFIPRIELFIEGGRLAAVKGGGRYGEMIGEMKDRHRNVHWPGYPDKGFFWYCDCALCTVVKAFRRKSDLFKSYWRLPNITERNRAGVFHQGIGSRRHGKKYLSYARKHNLNTGHIHVHNYFATFEVKIQDSEYWYKIVDKGRPTAMDDPGLRALAVKYGDPDDLLSFDWIPPLPGINCAGDYLTDYAPDPVAYLKKRIKGNEPI